MSSSEAPDLYGQYGEPILGPWGNLSDDVQDAWIALSGRVASRRALAAEKDAVALLHEYTHWLFDRLDVHGPIGASRFDHLVTDFLAERDIPPGATDV